MRVLIGDKTLKYTKFRTKARDRTLSPMIEDADGLRTDAAANDRFSTSMVFKGATGLLAYGTAVQLESN